jgi:hypothetical protein
LVIRSHSFMNRELNVVRSSPTGPDATKGPTAGTSSHVLRPPPANQSRGDEWRRIGCERDDRRAGRSIGP